jgi:replicative DNA helicase
MTESKPKSLGEYQGDDRVVSSEEMMLHLSKTRTARVSVKSGIPLLDYYCDGFRDGELIAISGKTKNGKTLLSQTLTVNFERKGHHALWFTYEVPAHQFLNQFPEVPTIYMPMKLKFHDMNWVDERIRESFDKYRTRIVFIDHLLYLVDMARTRNPSLEIGTIIRLLKLMAVNYEMVIFLMCHTTKGREGVESYEDIRDSSLIAQESDSVFMVKRVPDINENAARVRVEFHRRTGVMEKVVGLIKKDGLLFERQLSEGELAPTAPNTYNGNGRGKYRRDHDND